MKSSKFKAQSSKVIRNPLVLILAALVLICLKPAGRSATNTFSINQLSNAPSIQAGDLFYGIRFLSGTNWTNFAVPAYVWSNFMVSVSGNYVTQNCTVTAAGDTNTDLMTGAGTAGANGTYRWATVSYTNSAGTFGIYSDTIDWVITNSSGALLYSMSDNGLGPTGAWVTVTGANPPPSSAFDSLTNCIPSIYSVGRYLSITSWFNNVVYVRSEMNLSNTFAIARSGQTFQLDAVTNRVRGRIASSLSDVAMPDLKLSNLVNVVVKGNGTTMFHATNDGIVFGFQNCSNLLIEGVIFQGSRTNSGILQVANLHPYGLVAAWGTNYDITFKDCTFQNCNIFGIAACGDGGGVEIKTFNLKLLNCLFVDCGVTNMQGGANNPDGGAVEGYPDLTMEHCTLRRGARGVEMFSSSGMSDRCIIRDCVFDSIYSKGIFLAQLPFATRALVDGCWFSADNARRKGDGHVVITTTDGATVQNCTFTNIAMLDDFCINADGVSQSRNVSILNNVFTHVSKGVAFYRTWGGRIQGNTFFYCTNSPLELAADSPIVSQNLFWNCGQGAAANAVILMANLPGTNVLIAENRFIRKSGACTVPWIYIFDSGQRNVMIRDNIFDDAVTPAMTLLTDNGVNASIQFRDKVSFPSLTAGCYTNLTDDRRVVIPLSGIRTNKLAFPFRGHHVTIVNGVQNATAVVVRATSGLILNGSAFGGTNEMALGTNLGASAVFFADGTNWNRLQ